MAKTAAQIECARVRDLRRYSDDVVRHVGRVDGQPDARGQVQVEQAQLGQQPLRLGLLVGQRAQPLADADQRLDELQLRRQARSTTGTWRKRRVNFFI
jgi:hypothetical protein